MSKLKQVNDEMFTITRVKWGRGFSFMDHDGERIKDKDTLKRLRKLIIPPMWTEVMISQWPDGHVQATGRDKKGRKQYIYHDQWHRQQQQEKFSRMVDFGQSLPKIRQRCLSDIDAPGWPKEKVMALILQILDHTGIRIGNQRYTDENESYGLSTLRRKHMTIDGDQLVFNYQGKSNQTREVYIDDEDLIQSIRASAEQPGYEIFRYLDAQQNWQNIDSEEVNEYLQEVSQKQFYCKDFRTWTATRLAVEYHPAAVEEKQRNPRRQLTPTLLRLVADEIGNTPSVCKDYYIHPKVMHLISESQLPELSDFQDRSDEFGHSAAEKLLLMVLK